MILDSGLLFLGHPVYILRLDDDVNDISFHEAYNIGKIWLK